MVKDRDERQYLSLECQPDQVLRRAESRVRRHPIGLQAKALFGPVDHLAHGANLCLPDRAAGVHVKNDPMVRVDEVIVGIGKEGIRHCRSDQWRDKAHLCAQPSIGWLDQRAP